MKKSFSDSVTPFKQLFLKVKEFTNIEVVGIEKVKFSNRLEMDEISFEPPTVNLFSFNNPYGACRNAKDLE